MTLQRATGAEKKTQGILSGFRYLPGSGECTILIVSQMGEIIGKDGAG
jgi:hypothetical protein